MMSSNFACVLQAGDTVVTWQPASSSLRALRYVARFVEAGLQFHEDR